MPSKRAASRTVCFPGKRTATTTTSGSCFTQALFVAGWRLVRTGTGKQRSLLRMLSAPSSMTWAVSFLVDTLMNLPLLVWAYGQDGDPRLLEVVRRHTATALRHHLRPDGSVFHVYRFDEHNGDPLRGDTYQGLSPDSAWSRGQAWALTGLALLASMLKDASYLDASERVAAYFVRRLPLDGVPAWDFDAAGPTEPKDASAGAIASYGLLKLHQVTGNHRYLEIATRLLHTLSASCSNTTLQGGVLLHATADKPHGFGVDESTMYGDYYYLKSLVGLRKVVDNA